MPDNYMDMLVLSQVYLMDLTNHGYIIWYGNMTSIKISVLITS